MPAVNLTSGRHHERECANLLEWTLNVERRRRFCHQIHFDLDRTFNMHILCITTSVKFSSSNCHPTGLDVANASASASNSSVSSEPTSSSSTFELFASDTSTRSHAQTLSAQSSPIICVRSRSLADPPSYHQPDPRCDCEHECTCVSTHWR